MDSTQAAHLFTKIVMVTASKQRNRRKHPKENVGLKITCRCSWLKARIIGMMIRQKKQINPNIENLWMGSLRCRKFPLRIKLRMIVCQMNLIWYCSNPTQINKRMRNHLRIFKGLLIQEPNSNNFLGKTLHNWKIKICRIKILKSLWILIKWQWLCQVLRKGKVRFDFVILVLFWTPHWTRQKFTLHHIGQTSRWIPKNANVKIMNI